jgi:type I restriction enzyme S subunit
VEFENLPEGWKLKELGDVAEYINGYHFGPNDWKGSGVPIIRIQNLNDPEAPFNYFEGEIEEKYSVENGDLLISWSASLGAYFWNRGRALLNQHIFKVVENEALIIKDYLFYFVSSILEDIKRKTHGSTMKHITKKDFELIKIPLPPLEEQKKIVEILQFADYLKERRNEAIKLIDKIVMSVFYDMFGDPARNPKGWEVKRLGDIVQDVRYGITKTVNKKEQGVPVLRVTDINNDGSINSNRILNADLTEEEIEKYRLKPGDILIARSGATAGKCGIYEGIPEIAAFASYIIKITLDKSIVLPKFLHTFLNLEEGKRELLSGKGGSAQPNINSKSIKSIKIPLPPLALQQEFAEIVSKLEDKRKQMEEAEDKLEVLYQILLKQAFTGKLTEEWRMRH